MTKFSITKGTYCSHCFSLVVIDYTDCINSFSHFRHPSSVYHLFIRDADVNILCYHKYQYFQVCVLIFSCSYVCMYVCLSKQIASHSSFNPHFIENIRYSKLSSIKSLTSIKDDLNDSGEKLFTSHCQICNSC